MEGGGGRYSLGIDGIVEALPRAPAAEKQIRPQKHPSVQP